MAVKLDQYQTIVNVHWPDDDRRQYIITSAAFSAAINSFVTGDGLTGDDGIPYPLNPGGTNNIWTNLAVVDYYANVFTGLGGGLKFDVFDVYDINGNHVVELNDTQLTVNRAPMPATLEFGDYEVYVDLDPGGLDWETVGGDDVDPLFPFYKSGSAVLNFSEVPYLYTSSIPTKYWPGPPYDRNVWFELAPFSAANDPLGAIDVTPTSIIYEGDTYLPIGVRLTDPDGPATDYIHADVLFRKV